MRFERYWKLLIWLVLLTFVSVCARAQVLDFEQNPPHLSWRQIHTPHFQVIFPQELESEAQKLSTAMENMIHRVARSLGKTPRKISIILQNQTVVSNGFVQLAPRKSEFFTVPPPTGEIDEWLHHLAVHELRHVVQFDKLVGGFRAPFWEQLGLALFGLQLPSWFFEGDAVLTETLLTDGGRGRQPSWDMKLRTNLLNGKSYSYEKNYLGSMKDVTPGYYELGYFMVSKMRKEHSPHFLDTLLGEMARNPFRFYLLNRNLKKITGLNTRQWHEVTTAELKQEWSRREAQRSPIAYDVYPRESGPTPSDWLFPQKMEETGKIVALHQSFATAPEIVLLDSVGNKIETLVEIGWQASPHFSYAQGIVVWEEMRRNPRYSKQVFHVINRYDIENRTYKQLTRKTRLFSPTLSPDGKQIAVMEIGLDNQQALLVLDAESGLELLRLEVPSDYRLQSPAYHHREKKLVGVGVSGQGNTLIEINLETGAFLPLLAWQRQQLDRPVYWGDSVAFKAHYDGVDNLYLWESHTGKIRRLTNARFGAFHPDIDPATGELLFNNYQLGGHRISRLALDDLDPAYPPTWGQRLDYFQPLLQEQQSGQTLPDSTTWPSTRFRDGLNLFNFHSLSVTSGDFSSISSFHPGIYWLSDNLLNTTQTRVGVSFDPDLNRLAYHASIAYQRYFPKLEFGFRNRGAMSSFSNEDAQRGGAATQVRWRENRIQIGVQVPLVYYYRNYVYDMGAGLYTSYTQRYGMDQPAVSESFVKSIRFPLSYQMYFSRNVRRSALDLSPRWGQNLSLIFRHLPLTDRMQGTHYALRSTFYFPGFARNHGFVLRFNAQNGSGTYVRASEIPMVSGFDRLKPGRVQNTLLSSYHLPIAYPDWALGGLLFMKRIKGGVFADFENVGHKNPLTPKTLGMELRADMNFFRYVLPVFDVGAKLVFTNHSATDRKAFVTYSLSYSY